MRVRILGGALVAATALLIAGCGSDSEPANDETAATTDDTSQSLTVYSGRSEELVGPLLEQFTEDTGIEIEVRYGNTAEMAALILDEGENTPADVFFGQDAGALGALSAAGVLATLDADTLNVVDETYRSPDDTWVGTSGRARVVVYNTDNVTEADLPDAIAGFTDPQWAGRVGWAPTNASLQAFVTALRVLEGDDAALAWVTAMKDNGTQVYEGNGAIVDAVAAGEIDAGLVNHYYLYPKLAETPDLTAANKYYSDGDPGALVNVAGVAVLEGTDASEAAKEFVEYLLGNDAQVYFATETSEFPLVEGVPAPEELPALDTLTPPALDLSQLEDLEGTLALLQDAGVL